MRLKRKAAISLITIICLMVGLGSTALASTGAIWTTNATGDVQVNHFDTKAEVYLNGGPVGGGGGLPPGNYYVRVTDSSGKDVFGKTLAATAVVGSDGKMVARYQLIDLLYTEESGFTVKGFNSYDGVYKVWASQDPGFKGSTNKTSNFKVGGDAPPPPTGSITLYKVDSEETEPSYLAGAKFQLYLDNGNGTFLLSEETAVGTEQTTNTGGQITWTNLTLGTYWVYETEAPANHELADPRYQKVELTESTADEFVTFVNAPTPPPTKGSITLHKVDSDGQEPNYLAGAKFQLYLDNGNGTFLLSEETAVGTEQTTNTSGQITWTELDLGTYWAYETEAPEDHLLADPRYQKVELTESVADKSVTFINDPVTDGPAITIKKYVSVDGELSWVDADTEFDAPYLNEGTDPVFKFVVTNTGDEYLYNIEVIDSEFGSIGGGSPLAPDGVMTFWYREAEWTVGLHSNTATVTAYCEEHIPVVGDFTTLEVVQPCASDSDMAHYFGLAEVNYYLHGYKFNDRNNNGVDDEEPTLANWTIRLWTHDGEQYNLVATTATNSQGYYQFNGLCPETRYYITEGLKSGWTQTYPHAQTDQSFSMSGHGRGWGPVYAYSDGGAYTMTVEVPYSPMYAFGNYQPYTPPPGPDGTLTVIVVKTDGGNVGGLTVNITGAIGSTLTTNASGVVTLGGLYAGTYTANSGDTNYTSDGPKTATLASDSGSASITITLTPEQPPEPQLGAIHGTVTEEGSGDALPGATVTIYGPGGTVYTTVTSDGNGEFHVADVPPGNYTALGTLAGYNSDTDGPVTVVAGETAEMTLVLSEQQIIIPPDEPEEPEHPKTGVSYLPNVTIGAALMLAGLAVGRRRGRR